MQLLAMTERGSRDTYNYNYNYETINSKNEYTQHNIIIMYTYQQYLIDNN